MSGRTPGLFTWAEAREKRLACSYVRQGRPVTPNPRTPFNTNEDTVRMTAWNTVVVLHRRNATVRVQAGQIMQRHLRVYVANAGGQGSHSRRCQIPSPSTRHLSSGRQGSYLRAGDVGPKSFRDSRPLRTVVPDERGL